MRVLKGIGASDGFAMGPAFVYRPRQVAIRRQEIDAATVEAEVARWRDASATALSELDDTRSQVEKSLGSEHAAIFEAHALMLEDPELVDQVEAKIRELRMPAAAAIHEAAEFYANALASLDDEVLSARAVDVRDVARRVVCLLENDVDRSLAELTTPCIVVAKDLTPSDTARMNRQVVLGLCTGEGGLTSHTAIIARAIGLPAVVGLGQAWEEVCDQEPLIVDGGAGTVLASPDEASQQEYGRRLNAWCLAGDVARAASCAPAVTRDGRQVEIVANVGSVTTARAALDNGAEGVGLLRTEFLFLDRTSSPDEEEQYTAYRGIADVMDQRPVVVRTLDVGGDKPPAYLHLPSELNPFLGWRGVRISLAKLDMFKVQLRAILRAGAGRNLKIMFPMVTTVEEAREARRLVEECRRELVAEGAALAEHTEVGIMVEVPSAAVMADLLAPEVDFFSLGTNDLTQYTLAVDRGNTRVAPLYDWLHPAVLRLVKMVIDGGHRAGKWVGMCGEMAGDRKAIPLLLGLGLDEFSANPAAIPAAKELIRKLDTAAMVGLAQRALNVATAAEVHALVERALDQVA